MRHLLATTALAAVLLGFAGMASAQDGLATQGATAADGGCGKITIANMNWASAEVLAAIDQFILEHGFGCDAELVPGDTMPTFASMTEKGEPDVVPEMFVNQFRDQIDAAVKEGRVAYAAKALSDGSEEGFWIPQFIADANPQIRTVADALERPDLFPSSEDPSKGAVHNCPAGWGCQIMVENLFRAYDAEEKGFELVDTGSAAGLDGSITKAFESQKGWIGYYWSPTAIIGRYPMKLLAFDAEFDQEEWKTCTTQPDCADPKINAWTPADVYTLVTPRLADEAPEAAAYLNKRSWNNETVNSVLAWKEDQQATGEDTALHFLKSEEDVWSQWVSPEVAAKVKEAL